MVRLSAMERWESKVDKSGDCWLWTGPLDRYGYGKFSVGDRTLIAHRWGYTELAGPIPDGLTLDHLCHTTVAAECANQDGPCQHRRCVNPEHLEPVTALVNVLRGNTSAGKPECPQGHEYTTENTWFDGRGFRNCRACKRGRAAAWYRQRRKRAA